MSHSGSIEVAVRIKCYDIRTNLLHITHSGNLGMETI